VPLVSETYVRLCVEADDFLQELIAVASSHDAMESAAVVRYSCYQGA
jgi:hypothetical protein